MSLGPNRPGLADEPFPKTDPGNMRESSRPDGPERIRHEEAIHCGTDRRVAAGIRIFKVHVPWMMALAGLALLVMAAPAVRSLWHHD